MTKKCNPGVGAVPVIMIVLQIGPTYQTCIYIRCYDHNLNTDFEFDPVCIQWHFMKMPL